ncbi:MAG TPA: GDSL-type esterase/lipase family protein [Croceibacterium sp.]
MTRSTIRSLLAAALVALASSATAQTVTVDPANRSVTSDMQVLPVRVGGRAEALPLAAPMPAGARAFVHEWPGVYFETAFRGDRVILKFDDPANEYRLQIDDLPAIALAQPGTAEVTIAGLADTVHAVRLEKVTESIDLPATFAGFYAPASTRPIALPPPRPRKIEFIGDSIMAGYGVRSTTRQCTKEEVRLLTDTQAAYAALVAKRFDADYQINAISGRGLVRNYAGELPESPLPAIYPRALPSRPGEWHGASWQPQVIVVGLFTNDFSTPLKSGEKWASDEQLVTAFAAAYAPFLAELHRRSPDAAVLVIRPDMSGQPESQSAAMVEAVQREITAAAHGVGLRTILFPVLTDLGFEKSACDYHGSLADHRKLADWMGAYLEAHPELWQGN